MILKTKFISLHGFAYTGVLLFCSIMEKNLPYIVILSILLCILILFEFSKKDKSKNMRNYIYYDDFISVASIVPILWLYSKYAKPFVQTLFSKNNELSSHRFCLQSVCYQTCFVNFIRSFVVQPLMNPFTIEELYKFPETFSQFLCT